MTPLAAAPLPVFKRTALPAQLCNLGRLLDTLEERRLDGLVAFLRPNVFYLSGFAPPSNQSVHETNGYAAVVIARQRPEQPVIVVAEFDLAAFQHQPSWVRDVRPYATLLQPFDIPLGPAPLDRFIPQPERASDWAARARAAYAPSLQAAVRNALDDLGLSRPGVRLGVDDLRLAGAVAPPAVEVVDAYGALKYVRQVKTPAELALLRTATQLNQLAIERTIATWSRGTTWQELVHTYHVTATALGGFVRDPGAVVLANPPGADSALWMTGGLEDFTVEPGMHIMWDCHGTWQHYCWDGGKTWVVDDAPQGPSRVVATATAEAMGALQLAMRPGARLSQLQAAVPPGRAAQRGRGLHLLPWARPGAHRHGGHRQPPGLEPGGRHGRLGPPAGARRRPPARLAGGDLPGHPWRRRALLQLGPPAHRWRRRIAARARPSICSAYAASVTGTVTWSAKSVTPTVTCVTNLLKLASASACVD